MECTGFAHVLFNFFPGSGRWKCIQAGRESRRRQVKDSWSYPSTVLWHSRFLSSVGRTKPKHCGYGFVFKATEKVPDSEHPLAACPVQESE